MATIPLLLATGCSTTLTVSTDALCDGTRETRAAHARALVSDGGDQSVVTGQALLAQMQAACR
jgi:hypothetical protein